ncbi:hypothetical protein Ocin01_00580 [Orchesella cincta]|uniref:CARD domain-containing protein n=1 Tax=Orchesella cincta TaxID=48709 RepID=A0A1D2NLK8_ORCCI|nr:hypothetical protein Ocin01_00580 [Orchesella cincta]
MSFPTMEPPPLEVALNEVSRSNKSKDGDAPTTKESLLKRVIKENENSIIQSILSLPSSSSACDTITTNNGSSSGSTTKATVVTDGVTRLLDYLFEDGQLTRVEYDDVDKAYGIQSAHDQAQVLLRLLMDKKNDAALEVLLECLKSADPSSDTIRKLISTTTTSLAGSQEDREATEILKGKRRSIIESVSLAINFSVSGGSTTSRKWHDFYNGRYQRKQLDHGKNGHELGKENYLKGANRLKNKALLSKEMTDFRDFFLSNGCLEIVRNLIFDCNESLTASGWERVLRNMNGLLSTDVLSIKDSLVRIKCFEQQFELRVERKMAQEVKRIEKLKTKFWKGVDPTFGDDDILHGHANDDVDENAEGSFLRETDQDISASSALPNWHQIIYHSLQVWKQRNGLYSTFYSLIGVFQHSHLFQTADCLLENKMLVQSRETERDVKNKESDGNTYTSKTSSMTMLEKSDFLRKFYSPTNRKGFLGAASELSTTKDRVCASPVLSLDLL